jgi:hypothetical protein
MAWLLAGFGAVAGVAWAYSEATEAWDNKVSKPWNGYWNDRAIEQSICEREATRQTQIAKAKEQKKSNLSKLSDIVDTYDNYDM